MLVRGVLVPRHATAFCFCISGALDHAAWSIEPCGTSGAGLRHRPMPHDDHGRGMLVTLGMKRGGVAGIVREGAKAPLPGAAGDAKPHRQEAALETARRCHKLRERGVGLRRQDLASREGYRWPGFRGVAESDDVEKLYP